MEPESKPVIEADAPDTPPTTQKKGEFKRRHPVVRGLFIVLGSFFVILGVIGIVLPVLPTTPFILLASVLYMRSSEKLHHWVRNSPRFKHIFEKKGFTKREKINIMIYAWIVLVQILWVRILLVTVGCIKDIVFVKFIRTVTKDDGEKEEKLEESFE